MEKERPKEQDSDKEVLEHTVTIGGKPETVKLESGLRLSDLLKKISEQHPGLSLIGKSIMLNSRLMEHADDKLKEDPLLVVASTVTIASKVSGGIDIR